MYPEYQDRLAPDRCESFPIAWIAAENLLYLSIWIVAGRLLWPLQVHGWPVATLLWAALVVVIQALLKKHVCSGCYYYNRRCHLGWGKLSALLCAPDSGDIETGMRLALFYVLSPPLILAAAVLAGIFLDGSARHWILVSVFVALNAGAFVVRIRGCRVCAMREVCPGSAVRGK